MSDFGDTKLMISDRFLIDSSKANPEKLALIDDDSKFTFSELEEKVMKFSSFLNQFEEKSVNIEEVNTSIENAPMSASPLFMMHLIISSKIS